ncbi:MAG TPA: hypothetical protein VHX38_20695 [Pseudonocardiaceae bacterium]|nr:hypothetical protein [Pseudonocardiaceae bacterium]
MSQDDALRALIDEGGWRPLPGVAALLVYVRPWPDDSVDTLVITGDTDALGERTNPDGAPVWRHVGGLTEVIAAWRARAGCRGRSPVGDSPGVRRPAP